MDVQINAKSNRDIRVISHYVIQYVVMEN